MQKSKRAGLSPWCSALIGALLSTGMSCSTDGSEAPRHDASLDAGNRDASDGDAGDHDAAGPDAQISDSGDPDASDPECAVDATNASLPGVQVHIEGDACSVVSGELSEFRYRIQVTDPIEYAQPASIGCGPCSNPLISFSIGAGPVQYNENDVGCCPPLEASNETLAAGMQEGTIDWPGVQWTGPSDTNQPYGPRFPAGSDYKVRVEINVPGKGRVVAELPIIVLPADPFEVSGARACHVGQFTYPSGSNDVPDPESCNECSCEDGALTACTDIACPQPCPSGTERGTDCELCGSLDCKILHTGCIATCTAGMECAGDGTFCSAGVCSRGCE